MMNRQSSLTSESFQFNPVSGRFYYIDETKLKRDITRNVFIANDYSHLKNMITEQGGPTPKFNALYYTVDTGRVYAYKETGWIQVTTHDEVHRVISHLDDLTPVVMTNENGEYIAPATTLGNIYSEKGFSVNDVIGTDNLLRKVSVRNEYVEIEYDKQRVVNIPFPYSNYDFSQSYMGIIYNNQVIDPSKYVVNGDQVIFASNYFNFKKGESLLFTFYYTIAYNLNQNVVLNTENFANHSITTDKLDPEIKIKAYNIIETSNRIFFTPEEKNKLRHLNAENYVHPKTHPASMIEETDDRRWLSPENIKYWDAKANKEDVYTKDEVVKKIYNILNTEDLTSFRQIASAIANDPNFSTTILRQLSEKASVKDMNALKEEVDRKVFVNDYIKSTIYDLANKYISDGIDYYSITLSDITFGEYIDGMSVTMKIGETNKGKSMLRINQLPFKPIVNADQFELIEGDLKADSIYQLRYNGTTGNFILQGKGGVKLTDSSLRKTKVGSNGSVTRGNPIDINPEDNTINKSQFRIEPIAKLNTKVVHSNPKNLFVDMVDKNTIIVAWHFNGKAYGSTFKFNSQYIEYPVDKKLVVLHDDCDGYDVTKVSDNTYCFIFNKGDEITTKVVPIADGEMDITEITGTITKATGIIEKMYIIKSELDKVMLVYSHSNITETVMYQYLDEQRALKKIENRNNIDYPIDTYQKLNKNQILFIGKYLNTVVGWVLTTDTNDFYNSTTTRVAIATGEGVEISNVILSPLVDNRALMEYEMAGVRCKKVITLSDNGKLRVTDDSAYTENDLQKKHNTIYNRKYVPFIESYLSASNYDYDLESYTGTGKTIKIMLQREGNNGLFYTLDKNNQFFLDEEMNIHDIKLWRETIVFAYFDLNGKLKVALLKIRRKPDGISIENADTGMECKFYKF